MLEYGRPQPGIRVIEGTVDIFIIDMLNEQATNERIADVVQQAGGIDIVVNATSFMHDQGKKIADLSRAEFMGGIDSSLWHSSTY